MKLRFKNLAALTIIASLTASILPGCEQTAPETTTTTAQTETSVVDTTATTNLQATTAAGAPISAAALDGFWKSKGADGSDVGYMFLDGGNTASYSVIGGQSVGMIGKYEIVGNKVVCKYDEIVENTKSRKFADDPITTEIPITLSADGNSWTFTLVNGKQSSAFTKDPSPTWSPDMMKAVANEILAPAEQAKLVGYWMSKDSASADVARYAFEAGGNYVSLISTTDAQNAKLELKTFGTYTFDGHQLTLKADKQLKNATALPEPLIKNEEFAVTFDADGNWSVLGSGATSSSFNMKFVKDTEPADWAKQ